MILANGTGRMQGGNRLGFMPKAALTSLGRPIRGSDGQVRPSRGFVRPGHARGRADRRRPRLKSGATTRPRSLWSAFGMVFAGLDPSRRSGSSPRTWCNRGRRPASLRVVAAKRQNAPISARRPKSLLFLAVVRKRMPKPDNPEKWKWFSAAFVFGRFGVGAADGWGRVAPSPTPPGRAPSGRCHARSRAARRRGTRGRAR